jgi:hypothetical protein
VAVRIVGAACAALGTLVLALPAAAQQTAPPVRPAAAPTRPQPPKLNVPAAQAALSAHQVYRAPGAVAVYDESKVDKALGPDIKLLVEPFTGEYEQGDNYPTDDDYTDQVYDPMEKWATNHHVKLVDVTGLYVRTYDGAAFGPSDLPELRTQTAYLDVTSALLGMINYLRTGASHYDSPPEIPAVAPTAAQLAPVLAALRANEVYNAPGRPDPPLAVDYGQVTTSTGFTVRIASFPPVPLGRPRVDYATALARAFPGDDIFVNFGRWMDVAGPHSAALVSARDYAYGRYEDSTLEQGSPMDDRIGTILARAYELVREHPFSRPQPTPFDLRHRISAITPFVLLGSAVLLAGGSLVAWQRRRAEANRARKVSLSRESALATAAIAALGARLLHADTEAGSDAVAHAAERQSTASTMFDQATTPEAMRRVREIAEQGEGALR